MYIYIYIASTQGQFGNLSNMESSISQFGTPGMEGFGFRAPSSFSVLVAGRADPGSSQKMGCC